MPEVCNLCRGTGFREVWIFRSPLLDAPEEILRKPETYHIDECTACGLMQVRETAALRDEYLAVLYRQNYYDLVSYSQYMRKRPFRRLAHILEQYVRAYGKRLLEIGCAYGGFLHECLALGWEVEGVDLSAHAAEVATCNGLKVRAGDFLEVGLPPESYDVVVSLATVEHLRDPQQFLVDAARFVRPGGVLMLTTIDMAGLMPRLLGERWAQVGPPWHLYYFRQQHLASYLQNAGLIPLFVGGKLVPGTQLYRVRFYSPGHPIWSVGYVLFIARKE